MTTNISDLTAAISAQASVEQSVITMLNGLAAQVKAAASAPNPTASLDAVLASLQANTKLLSDAVTANTPAAPIATATVATVPVAAVAAVASSPIIASAATSAAAAVKS